jgi:hypothetical protein
MMFHYNDSDLGISHIDPLNKVHISHKMRHKHIRVHRNKKQMDKSPSTVERTIPATKPLQPTPSFDSWWFSTLKVSPDVLNVLCHNQSVKF